VGAALALERAQFVDLFSRRIFSWLIEPMVSVCMRAASCSSAAAFSGAWG
jgi:hypothetical protein